MYNREFPGGSFLFFISCKMSLFRLPCGCLEADVKNSEAPARRICPGWEPLFPGIFRTVEKFSKKLQIVQEIFLVVRFIRWYHDIDLRS